MTKSKPQPVIKKSKGTPGNYVQSKPGKGKIVKKKRSRHANSYEERQQNRQRKAAIAQKKQLSKERRLVSKIKTIKVIDEVSSWVKDNPLHPSSVRAPKQEGIAKPVVQSRYSTYKTFLRNLPKNTKPEEIEEFFYEKKKVVIDSIRLFIHRRSQECLGYGFLEFINKIEYEKSLTLSFSIFKGQRILVEGSLRSFQLSKRTPQKIISYIPKPRNEKAEGADETTPGETDPGSQSPDNDIQVIETEESDTKISVKITDKEDNLLEDTGKETMETD